MRVMESRQGRLKLASHGLAQSAIGKYDAMLTLVYSLPLGRWQGSQRDCANILDKRLPLLRIWKPTDLVKIQPEKGRTNRQVL